MHLTWTDLANNDLDEIEDYLITKANPVIAIDVVISIIEKFESLLVDHPRAGRTGRVKATRELVINSLPYVVIYRLKESIGEIQILRVLHDAQDWP